MCVLQRIGEETKQREYEEMRRRVRMLEEELKRKQQQPEKPYEITKETPPIRELTKEKVTLKKYMILL